METKYIIIAEFKNCAPFISLTKFDNFDDAKKRVNELNFKNNRVWICPITIYSGGDWAQDMYDQIMVQDFDD